MFVTVGKMIVIHLLLRNQLLSNFTSMKSL